MSKNNNNNSDNSLKYSLVGASILAGIGALGYWLYNRQSSSSQKYGGVKNLSKATTIKVLKQLKKELFTSFSTMSMMAQQIRAQTRGRASQDEVKEFVIMHPQINEEFKASEARAYKKHNVTQKEIEHAVEVLFKNDEEVQRHKQEIKSNFDKAASGLELDVKTEIPQSLTSQTTLQIIEEIMKASCKKIQEVFQELADDGGNINMNDPQTLKALNAMRIDEIKSGILEKYGLENYDDPGAKILQYATNKYQLENSDGFQEKMMQLDLKHRKSMELIQQNPHDKDIVEKTFAETTQAIPGGGMFGMRIGNRSQKNKDAEIGEKIVRNNESQEKQEDQASQQQQQNAEQNNAEQGQQEQQNQENKQEQQENQEQKPQVEDNENQNQKKSDHLEEESVEVIKKSSQDYIQEQSNQQQQQQNKEENVEQGVQESQEQQQNETQEQQQQQQQEQEEKQEIQADQQQSNQEDE